MGQGQDKIAKSLLELEPTAILELFLLYFDPQDQPDSFVAFHGGSIFQKPIKWQGVEYLPLPVETEGFEISANGRLSRPKIKVSNKDYIITDLLQSFNDLQFAKLIRKRTFVKFLDNSNFVDGNPWGQQDLTAELSNDTFIVSQKLAENKIFVEFELTSPLDADGLDLNNRKILSNYCPFIYRGDGCNYNGYPIANNKDENFNLTAKFLGAFNSSDPEGILEWQDGYYYNVGDMIILEDKNLIINYNSNRVPSKNNTIPNSTNFLKNYYVCIQAHTSSLTNSPMSKNRDVNWRKDECIKTISACKKRFNSESFTKLVTGDFSLTDNFIDFSTKVPEATGISLELQQTAQLNDFFNTGFHRNSFTIAMWITMPKQTAKTNTPYTIFTNANYLTQANTEGSRALTYYLWNHGLNQQLSIRQSDGTLKKNPVTNNPDNSNFWLNAGQINTDNSYQLLLFEVSEPTQAGGYTQLSINNGTPARITLGAGESFTFAHADYQNFITGHFKINANNIWGSWHDQSPRVTPANIHSVIIWSRLLNNAEKAWLARDDAQGGMTRQITESKAPRQINEITTLYDSLSGNSLMFWYQNNSSSLANGSQAFDSLIIKNGQTSDDLRLIVTGLNNDLRNDRKVNFSYEYSYSKTASDWLPFGGFPGTYKFSYGEV